MMSQEKSEKLIELMGWRKEWTDSRSMVLLDANGKAVGYRLMRSGEDMPDLYDPANMAVAARVILWAFETVLKDNSDEYHWLFSYNFLKDTRTALDNILKLATRAID